MEEVVYFATIYVFKDGELQVSIPCLEKGDFIKQFMKRVCVYEEEDKVRIRVVREGLPPFWLRVKEHERVKHVRSYVSTNVSEESTKKRVGEGVYYKDRKPFVGDRSDMFYDGWKGQKKKTFR